MTGEMNMGAFINLILALFIMLIVGYVSGKLKIIDSLSSKRLSKLIINVGQPALIIYNLIKTDYSSDNLGLGFLTLAFGLGLHIFMAILAYFAFCRFKNLDERKLSEFAVVFGNVGFIGIPILDSLFPDTGAFQGIFFNVSFQLMIWTWGIMILARKREDIKITPKKILINFGTVPSVIGIALFLLKRFDWFFIPEPILKSAGFLNNLCAPISTLIIGALLATLNWKQILGSWKVYYLCLIKLLAVPMLICGLMRLLGCGSEWILFTAAVTSMPSATTVSMLAELYDISPGYSAQAVGMTSLLSIATMPCVILFAQWLISI